MLQSIKDNSNIPNREMSEIKNIPARIHIPLPYFQAVWTLLGQGDGLEETAPSFSKQTSELYTT
jgi:hypothetical protein